MAAGNVRPAGCGLRDESNIVHDFSGDIERLFLETNDTVAGNDDPAIRLLRDGQMIEFNRQMTLLIMNIQAAMGIQLAGFPG